MSTIETEPLELLTVAETAEILRLAKPTVYRLVSEGVIPAHRIGGSIRIYREELLAAFTSPRRVEDT
jgi:excisionase family DNA binding protein